MIRYKHRIDNIISLLAFSLGILCIMISRVYDLYSTISLVVLNLGIALLVASIVTLLNKLLLQNRIEYQISSLKNDLYENTSLMLGKLSVQPGISKIFIDRRKATSSILDYISNEKSSILLIGTTLRGLVIDENFLHDLKNKIKSGCQVKALMVSPEFLDMREFQESRMPDALRNELYMTINILKEIGLGSSEIRVFKGVLSYSAIFTTKAVLFSPYLLRSDSYASSFSLLIEKNKSEMSDEIFNRFVNDFNSTWQSSLLVSETKEFLNK